jgi:hypothetical protein
VIFWDVTLYSLVIVHVLEEHGASILGIEVLPTRLCIVTAQKTII